MLNSTQKAVLDKSDCGHKSSNSYSRPSTVGSENLLSEFVKVKPLPKITLKGHSRAKQPTNSRLMR